MQWSFPNTYFTCQPQIERKLLKAMCKSANTLYFEVILILYAINQIIFLTSVFFFSGESTNASVTLLQYRYCQNSVQTLFDIQSDYSTNFLESTQTVTKQQWLSGSALQGRTLIQVHFHECNEIRLIPLHKLCSYSFPSA